MAEPDADSSLDLEPAKKPKLRGLWGVMRELAESEPATAASVAGEEPEVREEAARSVEAGAAADVDSGTANSEESDEAFTSPGRGLWALMGAGSVAPAATDSSASEAVESDAEEIRSTHDRSVEPQTDSSDKGAGGRGLWAVMQAMATDAPPASDAGTGFQSRQEPEIAEESDLLDDPEGDHTPAVDQSRATSPAATPSSTFPSPALPSPLGELISPAPLSASTSVVPSRVALMATVAGGLAVPLSILAAQESWMWRLPASAVGFFGLAAGLAGWNEVARPRSRRSGKGMAIIGIACGVVGMFLGPLIVAPLGTRYRETTGDRMTSRHLSETGQALDQAYEKRGHYPEGALIGPDAEGRDRSLHGWMTSLLPYLGEGELFASIDLTKPYNAVKNQPAMKQRVAAFEAAGGDVTPVESGFAAAHFAGVGGTIDAAGQGVVHLGVFDRGSAVHREQIVDGLSNTLIVGEIAHRYPAWGDPENWRMVGSGLNKQPHGFGNAAGTGATFLKADGSVRFFSNRVSSDVLQRLSTRDGNDPVDDDEF